jgi:hypothetical protein
MTLFENLLLELLGRFVDGGMGNENHGETDVVDLVDFCLLVDVFVNLTHVLSQEDGLLAK